MAKFEIVREPTPDGQPYTAGVMNIGARSLFTLELPWDNNNHGTSCIPEGTYPCVIAWSNRYHRLMPRLLNVENRDGILIHTGNTSFDTRGCILVGSLRERDGSLLSSVAAFFTFMDWLGQAAREGPVECEIRRS